MDYNTKIKHSVHLRYTLVFENWLGVLRPASVKKLANKTKNGDYLNFFEIPVHWEPPKGEIIVNFDWKMLLTRRECSLIFRKIYGQYTVRHTSVPLDFLWLSTAFPAVLACSPPRDCQAKCKRTCMPEAGQLRGGKRFQTSVPQLVIPPILWN